jgi:hypothetical protein
MPRCEPKVGGPIGEPKVDVPKEEVKAKEIKT